MMENAARESRTTVFDSVALSSTGARDTRTRDVKSPRDWDVLLYGRAHVDVLLMHSRKMTSRRWEG